METSAVKNVGVLVLSCTELACSACVDPKTICMICFQKAHVLSGCSILSLASSLQCLGTRSGHGKQGMYKLLGNLIVLTFPWSSSNLKTNAPFPFACKPCLPMLEMRCSIETMFSKWSRLSLMEQEVPVLTQILKESESNHVVMGRDGKPLMESEAAARALVGSRKLALMV